MLTQAPLNLSLEPQATFDNFVVGSNIELVSALKHFMMGSSPSLYFYGPTSSGKSHLLQACCQDIPMGAIVVPMKEWVHHSPEIFEGLEHCSLVCMDDIQVIANKTAWEEAFFHLYNRLRQSKTQLIVAATDVPRSLGIALPDLLSRLSWGAIYQVKPLTDDEKIAALQLRVKQQGLELPVEVAAFLMKRSARDMQYLLTMISTLDHASLVAQRKLTIPFVKEVLKI